MLLHGIDTIPRKSKKLQSLSMESILSHTSREDSKKFQGKAAAALTSKRAYGRHQRREQSVLERSNDNMAKSGAHNKKLDAITNFTAEGAGE